MGTQIYISMNSSQSFFKKEAVLISDSCGSETNICDITIQAGADNVNQPQVTCAPCSDTGSGPGCHTMWGALEAVLLCHTAPMLYRSGAEVCVCSIVNNGSGRVWAQMSSAFSRACLFASAAEISARAWCRMRTAAMLWIAPMLDLACSCQCDWQICMLPSHL